MRSFQQSPGRRPEQYLQTASPGMAPLAKEPIAIRRDLQFVILPALTSLPSKYVVIGVMGTQRYAAPPSATR
jgi:hypothetical protein